MLKIKTTSVDIEDHTIDTHVSEYRDWDHWMEIWYCEDDLDDFGQLEEFEEFKRGETSLVIEDEMGSWTEWELMS